jgi:hypothetical protein
VRPRSETAVAGDELDGLRDLLRRQSHSSLERQVDRDELVRPAAVVAPIAQYVGLTRESPGGPPGELERVYPGGRRHFTRVFPADDAALRAVAAAVRGRLVIVEDGRPDYGALLADNLAHIAGPKVAGRVCWNPQRPRSRARRARRPPSSPSRRPLYAAAAAQVVFEARATRARGTCADAARAAPCAF